MRMIAARTTAIADSIEAAYSVIVAVDWIPSSFVVMFPRVEETVAMFPLILTIVAFIVSSFVERVPTEVFIVASTWPLFWIRPANVALIAVRFSVRFVRPFCIVAIPSWIAVIWAIWLFQAVSVGLIWKLFRLVPLAL